MRLKEIGEDRLISEIIGRFSRRDSRLIKGIGDDAAVAAQRPANVLLATTDVLIEGVHFQSSYTPARLLGRKALAISLSDIAAMGGDPTFFLVSLGLPPDTTEDFLKDFYRGIDEEAKKFRAVLAGGNISRSKTVFISLTLSGSMSGKEVIYREGAKVGDDIHVTGTLGDSALGLKVLKEHGAGVLKKGPFKGAAKKHLDPTPRMEAGKAIAKKRLATAMIDISDGLVLDLERLAEASRIGALVDSKAIPMSADLKRYGRPWKGKALKLALSGGEDYELLFTARPEKKGAIEKTAKRLGLPITRIGKVIARSKGVTVMDEKGRPVKTTRPGFVHF
ncbi:MAG: thiamine-phosphate kinase [Thermodesulfobacteriota bacterium]|nr:MAG: thiamine-phosphate kinase [Thermodesulfobacteriota bacterium]